MIIDGYRLKMYAHCGMSYDIATTDDDSINGRLDMQEQASRFIADRVADGYNVDDLTPEPDEVARYELTEPEDAAMVPDDAGLLIVEPIPAKTVDCWNCGCEVRVGDVCGCNEPYHEDIATDDTEDN